MNPTSWTSSNGIRVHAIAAGSIRITTAHEEMKVPAPLRLPAILADRRLADPFPLLAHVIEHPEGVFVVDVGETRRTLAGLEEAAPDAFTRWLFRTKFDGTVDEGEELVEQLPSVGVDPASVGTIVVSHLHFDHVGGLASFPEARVVMSRVEYESQLKGDGIPGISFDVKATRMSKHDVLDYARRRPTVFLPAHDPEAPQRLSSQSTVY